LINSWKVARWEIKRNLKNKSFLISLIVTPLIFLLFITIPVLLSGIDNAESEPVKLYVKDEIGIWNEQIAAQLGDSDTWEIVLQPENEQAVMEELEENENVFYIVLTEQDVLEQGRMIVYTNEKSDEKLVQPLQFLEQPLQMKRLMDRGFSQAESEQILRGIKLDIVSVGKEGEASEEDTLPLRRIIPAAFAGLILFSVIITGTMIFQSASQEKKDKVAEMILSSVTPSQLMDGKIIGYFILGLIQVAVWISIALPVIQWRLNFNLITYLLVPETLLLLLFAIAGYFMFAALFVGLGATIEDISTSGNFQGIVFMLPWIPFILFGPVVHNPEGIVAQVASYVPITSPAIMIFRMAIMEEWPWVDIVISIVLLLLSIWLFMKLAGKIFKTGILMYGKNATPMEIWKWLRH
jgi:ABC-2 type transport system permease protein